MNSTSKALIMIGSPKPGKSASGTLATHIAENLVGKGFEIETIHANQTLKSDEGVRSLLASFDNADVIVVVFPLYVDSLPAGLTKALELMAEHRRAVPIDRKQRMMAVCQNGFPEAHQNETALGICRLFTRDSGIEWAGGLAFGGGGVLDGRELGKMGGMVRNLVKALDIACSDLADGRPVSQEAVALMAKPMMPRWLYVAIGSYGWKRLAKKNQVLDRLHDRPYQESRK